MVNGLIGRKVGMTQLFMEDGRFVPVTLIQAGPCVVVQRKTSERDGYEAAQLGLVEKKPFRKATRPTKGHFEKGGRPADARAARVPARPRAPTRSRGTR